MAIGTIILNVLLFEAGWLASVLGAANGLPWAGVAVIAVVAAFHLARSRRALPELLLLAIAFAIGALFESLLVQTGWLRFDGGTLAAGTAPVWMAALWINFATTLNVALRALHARPAAAALLGAIAAPVAYYAGARLGAVEMVAAAPALAAIAAGWSVLTPALLAVARRLDGYGHQ